LGALDLDWRARHSSFQKDRQGLLCAGSGSARQGKHMCAWPPRRPRPPARPGGNRQGASILSFLGIDRSHECNKERQRPFARLARPHIRPRTETHAHKASAAVWQQAAAAAMQGVAVASLSSHFPPACTISSQSEPSQQGICSVRPATVATHKNGGEGSTLQTIHLQYIGGRAMHGYICGLAGSSVIFRGYLVPLVILFTF
jgi:hypothetical protein